MNRYQIIFFFQAEDGIRYKLVTGVQTCALPISVGEPIRGYPHRARGKPVEGVRLVGRARQQAGEGELHALRAIALEDEDVERIEGEKVLIEGPGGSDLGERAALRRIGVDVVEMLESRRIFEVAERRDAVPFGALLRQRRTSERRSERTGAQCERMASRHLADVGHGRVPVLAAFSASHHHTVGKADAPYFGSGSCRLKRSQRAVRLLSKVNCGTT